VEIPEWIGVDLDGTLAIHTEGQGIDVIGEPISDMVARIHKWVAEDKKVKIFTARVARVEGFNECNADDQEVLIQAWLAEKGLPQLEITATKDWGMTEFYDDRAIQVERNTGRLVGYSTRK
jgi:hypothetical protein